MNLLRNYGLHISTHESILAQRIFDSHFSISKNRLHDALKSILIRDVSDSENFDRSFNIFFQGINLNKNLDSDRLSNNNSNQEVSSNTDDILTDVGEGVNANFISDNQDRQTRTFNDSAGRNVTSMFHEGVQKRVRSNYLTIFADEFIRWTESKIQFVSHSISYHNNIRREEVIKNFVRVLVSESKMGEEDIIKIYHRYAQSLKIALKQSTEMIKGLNKSVSIEIENMAKIFRQKLDQFLRETRKILIQENIVTGEDFSEILYYNQPNKDEYDLLKSDFSKINKNIEEIKTELIKLGKKLAIREKRRQKFFTKGKIDFRKTFRSNLSHGGTFLDIKMRTKKPEIPEIFLLLDVSMSMSWIAEFFFLISYAGQLIWKLNLFEFNNTTVEMTEILKCNTLENAYNKRKNMWRSTIRPRIGHSNYETSLEDFSELTFDRLTKKSRIILLGDCRDYLGYWRSSGWENSRFGEPESKYWIEKLVNSTKEVLILNPEPKSMWNTGDSVCEYYSKVGAKIHYVNNLESLIKFIFKY
jgi:uncharacterized protein with von Willebrand factor type A (vWA) domain